MQRLTGLDATFLYLETPSTHMHVASTAIFDPSDVTEGYSFDKVMSSSWNSGDSKRAGCTTFPSRTTATAGTQLSPVLATRSPVVVWNVIRYVTAVENAGQW